MTDDIQVEIDPAIFNRVYRRYLDAAERTQIFFGGSSSGKSWFLAQRCVIDLMRGERNYLICRAVARTIRTSVFQQIDRVIREFGVQELFQVNKSDAVITCENGMQALFAGLDDVEKIKSITPKKGALTDIWIEEATECRREDIKALYKRQRGGSETTPKRLTMSFNPILRLHWIFTDFFAELGWADDQTRHKAEDLLILKTTYKDNRFLTKQDVHDLETEKDEYFRAVYTLGNWGVLGDVIFTNWKIQDLTGMAEQWTNPHHGLDFGFGSAPAAMPVTHYDKARQTIYIYQELYERGLTNDLLAAEIKKLINKDYVVCDSAEPKSVAELVKHGVNAVGAKKGKDSVEFGIQWLQQQTIIVDTHCIHAQNEFQQYQWKKDKDGNSMKVPVDRNNHLIDGLRYGYESEMEETWWFS